MPLSRDADSGRSPIRAIVAGFVCVCVFLFYWAVLSDGAFLAAKPVRLGLMFNSMLDHMSHGRFDVDPSAIGNEGFRRDSLTYAYFGPLPALWRLPMLLWPRLRGVDFTTLSCAIAAALGAIAKLAAVMRARRAMGDAPYPGRVAWLGMATVIFGGEQLQFLRASIYQEALFWACAFAAGFVLLAFRWCIDPPARRDWHVAAMAALAALCLLTRVSTAIGLYAGCGAIMLTRLLAGRASIPAAVRRELLPSLILLAGVAICGFVNQERWGSPLTFQDYRYYNLLTPNDPALTVVAKYGFFNIERVWFAFLYYFAPIWSIIDAHGHFLFRTTQDRLFFIVEGPPATFLLTDLFLLFLACMGCAWLWRAREGADRLTARLVAGALALPGLLMLTAIATIHRYRMEFYPVFEFLALFGLSRSRCLFASRARILTWACGGMIGLSFVCSCFILLLYKVEPGGTPLWAERDGWMVTYRRLIHPVYPRLDRLTGYVAAPK